MSYELKLLKVVHFDRVQINPLIHGMQLNSLSKRDQNLETFIKGGHG